MIGRRGFLGALTGLPIAAVVMPKVSVPEVTAPPTTHTACGGSAYTYSKTFFDNGLMTPSEVRQREGLVINITCDTTEFQREVARAQRTIDAVERRLERALYRGIKVERA